MKVAIKGVIHGKIIELDKEPGIPDGQTVSVMVETVAEATAPSSPEALEALHRAAGAWADDLAGLDLYLGWNRERRKGSRPEVTE